VGGLLDLAPHGYPGYFFAPDERRVYRIVDGRVRLAGPASTLDKALRTLARLGTVGTL